MPRVVAETDARHNAMVNSTHALWARNVLPDGSGWAAGSRAVQAAIARQMGCAPEEIGVTRSGADALQMLISGRQPAERM